MSVGKGFFKRVPGASVRAKLLSLIGALVVIGAVIAGGLYYAFPVQISIMGALSRNYLITFFAPGGTATTNRTQITKVPDLSPRRLQAKRRRPRRETGRATTERST